MTVPEREGEEEGEGLRLPLRDMEGVGLELGEPMRLALPLVHWDTVPVAQRVKVGEVLPVRLPLGLAEAEAQRVEDTVPVPLRQEVGDTLPH